MKKILFITNIPAPYTVDFFNDLGCNFELTVLFEGRNAAERDSSWENFEAKHFKYIIIENRRTVKAFRFPKGLRKALNQTKYDLYIIGNYSTLTGMMAIRWLRSKNLPYAIHADGGIISDDSFLHYQIKKYFLKGANLYFSSGRMTTDYFVHYGADKARVYEYPFSSIRKCQIRIKDDYDYRKKLNLKHGEKIIVSVGQIIPRKGFDVLIKSVNRLKIKPYVYIIGGNPSKDLTALIQELNLENIEFIPFLPFSTILEYMAACDLFVLLTREDIWGLVINEAFAIGAPIVSTDRCIAAVEMIEDGENGFVVESENPKMAADKIENLLENTELCLKMRDNNIQKAEMYTIEAMCDTYTNIINDYFNGKS